MKVKAIVNLEVLIDPKEVIQKLIENEIGDTFRNWILEKDGNYFHIQEKKCWYSFY